MEVTKALAYSIAVVITVVKSFIVQGQEKHLIELTCLKLKQRFLKLENQQFLQIKKTFKNQQRR